MAFSPLALDHIANPRNARPAGRGDAQGCRRRSRRRPLCDPCGSAWRATSIREASYETYGCPAAVACASLTVEDP